MQPAKLLRIHLSENDRHEGRPLYEVFVECCRELGLAGATVLRGVEGYGETATPHHTAMVGKDRPLVIVVVDTLDNLSRLIPEVERLLHTGVMALSDVRVKRAQKAVREVGTQGGTRTHTDR